MKRAKSPFLNFNPSAFPPEDFYPETEAETSASDYKRQRRRFLSRARHSIKKGVKVGSMDDLSGHILDTQIDAMLLPLRMKARGRLNQAQLAIKDNEVELRGQIQQLSAEYLHAKENLDALRQQRDALREKYQQNHLSL